MKFYMNEKYKGRLYIYMLSEKQAKEKVYSEIDKFITNMREKFIGMEFIHEQNGAIMAIEDLVIDDSYLFSTVKNTNIHYCISNPQSDSEVGTWSTSRDDSV